MPTGNTKLVCPSVAAAAVAIAVRERRVQQSGILPDGRLDLARDIAVLLEEGARRLASLADARTVIGIPGAGFLHDPGLHPQIQQFAGLGNAAAVHDVELDLLER